MKNIVLAAPADGMDVTALVSLFIAVIALISTFYWNRRVERRSYLDEFWFRQVVAPNCIDPVIKFHGCWVDRIDGIRSGKVDANFIRRFVSDFQLAKSTVLDSSWVAKIFSKVFYEKSCRYLDKTEDVFAEQLAAVLINRQSLSQAQAEMKAILGDASVGILSEAAAIHGGRLKPQKLKTRNWFGRAAAT